MDSLLQPPSTSEGTARWWHWGAKSFVSLGVVALTAAAALSASSTSSAPSSADSSNTLRLLATTLSCPSVDCGQFARSRHRGHCKGPETSKHCQKKCCKRINCDHIVGFSCGSNIGPSFMARMVPHGLEGLHRHRKHCKGEDDCKDRCCQGTCAETTCSAPYLFKRPFPPKLCTLSTCQSQCCYDESYCGNGLNAWSSACKAGKSKLEWCEGELMVSRSSVTQSEWNHLVYEKVDAGALPPGCEEDSIVDCRVNLHYSLVSVFTFHRSDEGVSVNTVAVVPGATEALSGGDDQQVFKWRIVQGNVGILRNYSSHTAAIKQVYPFADATFFCAATAKEAMVWLVQAGHDHKDSIEMEFTPEDPRKGAGPVGVTGCIGLNTYETAVVGLTNSYAALWEWKVSHFLSIPVDPKLEFRWEIEKDFGYYKHWPAWDTGHGIKKALLSWWEHRYHLWRGYAERRLTDTETEPSQGVVPPEAAPAAPAAPPNRDLKHKWLDEVHTHVKVKKSSLWYLHKKLRRSSKAAPWDNTFTNLNWGDVPNFFYKPDGWGAVTALVEIPSDTLFVLGYEDGSIRTWRTYNGFIVSVIPKAHAGGVNALLAAPAGGSFYSGGHDGFIKIWRAINGHPVGIIYSAFAGPVASLAMIPGGNAIYSGHYSGLVYLWAVSGTALCKLDTEGGKVNSMAVNPGTIGQLLIAQENGYVTVWSQR